MRLFNNLTGSYVATSLVFVGITSVNLAQGALNGSAKIVLLAKQISALQAQVGTKPGPGSVRSGQNLDSRVAKIELAMTGVNQVLTSFFSYFDKCKILLTKK